MNGAIENFNTIKESLKNENVTFTEEVTVHATCISMGVSIFKDNVRYILRIDTDGYILVAKHEDGLSTELRTFNKGNILQVVKCPDKLRFTISKPINKDTCKILAGIDYGTVTE